jgi:hypothetical protein
VRDDELGRRWAVVPGADGRHVGIDGSRQCVAENDREDNSLKNGGEHREWVVEKGLARSKVKKRGGEKKK